jgi:hypothetical protein
MNAKISAFDLKQTGWLFLKVRARVRVARMQKEGLPDFARELELRREPFLLVGVRRVVAIEVQPALADRNDAWMRRERA